MNLSLKAIIAILTLLSLAPSACADDIGQKMSEGIGRERTLLATQDGWNVYRARNIDKGSCFAYKIAEKEKSGPIRNGTLMASGSMWGSRGIKMWIPDRESKYSGISGIRLGFFGDESNWSSDVTEINGKIYRNIKIPRNSDITLDDFLQMDGTKIQFEVNSSEYEYAIGDTDFFQGEIDLTGIKIAREQLLKCHDQYKQPPIT